MGRTREDIEKELEQINKENKDIDTQISKLTDKALENRNRRLLLVKELNKVDNNKS